MEVRFLNVTAVTTEQIALWESWLTQEKRQRLEQMTPQRRRQSLCGDALARQMLATVLGIAPQDVAFTYTKSGKPLVNGAYFSISHSGDLVGCAVSEYPIGLDVEQIRSAPPRLCRALDAEGKSDRDFFQLWTKREALLKCRGETVAKWRNQDWQQENYKFSMPEVPDGYCATICEEK